MGRHYSHYHSLARFISKCIPKRGVGLYKDLFVHNVIEGLQRLDAAQRANPAVTLPFDVDGINVFHKGARIFRIMPAQKNLLLLADDESAAKYFDHAIEQRIFEDSSQSGYRSWRVPVRGLDLVWKFIEGLPKPEIDEQQDAHSHPRYFSAAARLEAYETFQREGSVCPGFGKRKPHKLQFPRDRIEYDHLLPFARGGSSSEKNIRVVCYECNRLKGANVG